MKVKTKRTICVVVAFMAFLAMLCIVWTSEHGDISIVRTGVLAGLCELVGAAALWKAGWIKCHQ